MDSEPARCTVVTDDRPGDVSRVMGSRPIVGAAAVVLAVVAGGCGPRHVDRSVLLAGVQRVGQPQRVVDDREAARRGVQVHDEWLATIRSRALTARAERFPSPPAAVLRARLARAARRYGFVVRRADLRRPLQLAPDVTIESDDFVRASQALGAVIDAIDPARPAHTNSRAYEAVFVELVDDRGIPYAIAFNALRGRVEGGEWARAEALYPFAHG
jgi:hypothetical protein